MVNSRFALAVVVGGLALLIGSSPPTEPMKCGQPGAGQPLIALDGELIGVEPDSVRTPVDASDIWSMLRTRVDASDVWSMQPVCMNPRDSTFVRGPGIPVISIWTKSGPISQLEPTLVAILEAQDAHFAVHGTYEADLNEIELPYSDRQYEITVDVQEEGWVAQVRLQRAFQTCVVYDGSPVITRVQLPPRTPRCFDP